MRDPVRGRPGQVVPGRTVWFEAYPAGLCANGRLSAGRSHLNGGVLSWKKTPPVINLIRTPHAPFGCGSLEGWMYGRILHPYLHTSSHPNPNSASGFGITRSHRSGEHSGRISGSRPRGRGLRRPPGRCPGAGRRSRRAGPRRPGSGFAAAGAARAARC